MMLVLAITSVSFVFLPIFFLVKKKEVKEKRTKAEVPPHMTCALDFHETEGEIVGKTLWRRSGKSRTMKPVGEVTFIETNPHTGLISAKFAGNERTFHRLSSLYLRVIS